MKKSLLALAVVAVAASANAATVYDKDGTSLKLDGRVQAVFYNGNHKKSGVAEHDSTIKNSGRFGIGGRTQIADWVAGFGYAQWDVSDGSDNGSFSPRDQYVGADFGEFGKVQAGRFRSSEYYVENLTDHYEDAAGTISGNYNGNRRGGQIMYTYDNYGLHAQLGFQTAQDSAKMIGNKVVSTNSRVVNSSDSWAIDSGVNGALGYTFDDVLFGPLNFRAGYSYVKGQQDGDLQVTTGTTTLTNGYQFDNFKHANFGIAWGNYSSGWYLAAIYEYAKLTDFAEVKTEGLDNEWTNKGYELAVGYAFDNGINALLGYEATYMKYETSGVESKTKYRRIPLFINYKANANFNVWTEFGFNAGSDHEDLAGNPANYRWDKTVFSVGARYTF